MSSALGLLPLLGSLLLSAPAGAAPVLRAADVRVSFSGPTACDVEAAYTVEADAPLGIEHRIEARLGTQITDLRVDGRPVGATVIGSTQSFVLAVAKPGFHSYRVGYAVVQPDDWAFRCPLALPAAAADGVSREVDVAVELPEAARPGRGSLPALAWSKGRGLARLPHLPAVVRVPFAAPGARVRPGRDLGQLMDAAAAAMLAAATLFWVWRRRR